MKRLMKRNKKQWLVPVCATAAVLLALTALILALSRGSDEPEPPAADVSQSPAVEEEVFQGINLGGGLTLEGLSAMSGPYPEDGSDTYTENMMCATFTNSGSATLQYAKVCVTVDGTDYTFELSTLPVGESLCAFALDMQTAPGQVESVSAQAEYLVWFSQEPSAETDKLQVTFGANGVTVKNISGEDIDQEISVYFKTVVDGTYMGGITYRVRVSPLAAGEEGIGYSSHTGDYSELMFVTYGS